MVTNSYYRGTQGVVFTYDVTDKESFENLEGWISEVGKIAVESFPNYSDYY